MQFSQRWRGSMTPEQIADCQGELLHFTRTMFKARKGIDLKDNWHQEEICDALERVVLGDTTRLIINIPPRSGKTELAVINFIAWATGLFPDSHWIHASYSKRLATNNAFNVRELMRHEAYAQIFPWIKFRQDSAAKDEFHTEQGGVVYATGAEGSITGRGAGGMSGRFQGCFPYSEMVKTEHGPMPIGDIVSSGEPIRVWSYNESTKKAELKSVKATFVNPANHIIEISSSDGRKLRCTPDHEVLTRAGWVSAVHLAKALYLVDGNPSDATGFFSGETPVNGNTYDFIRMFWFCVPLSIREMLCNAYPSLAELDLADNPNANPVHFGEFGCAEVALEYFQSFFSCEFGTRSALQQGECPVTDSVLHVVALCAIREIGSAVVGGVSVKMPNLITLGPLAYEMLSNEVGDISHLNNTINRQVNPEVAFSVTRAFKRSLGVCPPNLAGVRNFIQPFGSTDWQPDRIGYVGFHNETYCIEVEDNNNFILSQSGAIVSNCIIVDDPHKPGEASSDVMRGNVIDWFSTTMESRKNNPDTPIIIIKQRLHESDLSGFLLAGGNGEHWEHLNIPAIGEDGNSFWPEQFPLDDLRRMEASNAYRFAGQYMQNPAPIGGGIFKDEWWQYYRALPQIKYRMVYADTALKTKEQNDYSVFQCWGAGADGKIYLLDMVRGKWEAPQLLTTARAFWDKHKAAEGMGALRQFKPEDKASGTGLIQQLKQSGVPVVGIQRSIDKATRAMDAAPQIQVGNVCLPESAPWVSDLLTEATQFPNGAHDDCLDPLMDAVDDMLVMNKNRNTLTTKRLF